MITRQMVIGPLLTMFFLSWGTTVWASFDIQSEVAVRTEIKGYEGLSEFTLFQGKPAPGMTHTVATTYKGLALVAFEQGQVYPLILGKQSFLLKITSSDTLPSFSGSGENEYLYALLKGAETEDTQYEFADLMIESKQLLNSTGSIRTVDELRSMKEKFHAFVRSHYQDLSHSDMLRRLIAQYFMMHEYVSYYREGYPASDIRVQYQKEIVDGVRNWLNILKPNIPEHEILNYCVSLYYSRSMVSLASKIMDNFREVAFCPGEEKSIPTFPPTLNLKNVHGRQKTLQKVTGKKMIAFVSDSCPVSKIETVVTARRLARKKNETLIVAPLQSLSADHLAISRMVSGGNIMFIDDEKWRKENMPAQMKLPRFIQIE